MAKTTSTRRRFERRKRRERLAWMKANLLWICAAIFVVVVGGMLTYRFWYNYIPSNVDAAEGQAKVYIEYRVVAGDTLDGICNRYFSKYGYDRPCSFENEVICRNNLQGRISYLQIGQTIELPRIVNTEVHDVLND